MCFAVDSLFLVLQLVFGDVERKFHDFHHAIWKQEETNEKQSTEKTEKNKQTRVKNRRVGGLQPNNASAFSDALEFTFFLFFLFF